MSAARGAGALDRRITLQQASTVKNDFGEDISTWGALPNGEVWASYWPVSDGEKWRAGMVESRQIARFTIRYSTAVSAIGGENRLQFEGGTWSITGVKEIGRREFLEITAELAE